MFENLCKMSQADLKEFVTKALCKTHDKVISDDGYVYAHGTFPVLLVAHLDTVHKELPSEIIYDTKNGILSSPQGIGGDDRCGVYMILEVIKKHNCSVLFCEDEEIGCVGASKFVNSEIAQRLDFNYMIEFDRRGYNDAVFYDCDNIEFTDFITDEFYEEAIGSYSDISVLAPFFGCAAVNLSCGYYYAHTTQEYVELGEMKESIKQACKILAKTTIDTKFKYVETKSTRTWWDDFKEDKDENHEYFIEWFDDTTLIDEYEIVSASSMTEAVGKFCMAHPDIPYRNIDVYEY